jgi:DUF4097 and DUF4098 domain-containing protein YvlB
MQAIAAAALTTLSIVGLLSGCRQSSDRTLEEMFDQTYSVSSTATFSITNRDGSIRIYGTDGETRDVRVEAIKKAYSTDRLKSISVQVSATQDSVSVQTIYPNDSQRGFSDRSGTVDYIIVLPQTTRISKLELGNGEVLVEEMRSDEAHAQLGNGRLFAHNCFGSLDLNLGTGNLAIVYEWWEEQEFAIHAHVQNGNAFAYIPSDAAFHLIAHTVTGKIANDFSEQEDRHPEPVSKIDMLVGDGATTTLQFETQDGNITISEHNP